MNFRGKAGFLVEEVMQKLVELLILCSCPAPDLFYFTSDFSAPLFCQE